MQSLVLFFFFSQLGEFYSIEIFGSRERVILYNNEITTYISSLYIILVIYSAGVLWIKHLILKKKKWLRSTFFSLYIVYIQMHTTRSERALSRRGGERYKQDNGNMADREPRKLSVIPFFEHSTLARGSFSYLYSTASKQLYCIKTDQPLYIPCCPSFMPLCITFLSMRLYTTIPMGHLTRDRSYNIVLYILYWNLTCCNSIIYLIVGIAI